MRCTRPVFNYISVSKCLRDIHQCSLACTFAWSIPTRDQARFAPPFDLQPSQPDLRSAICDEPPAAFYLSIEHRRYFIPNQIHPRLMVRFEKGRMTGQPLVCRTQCGRRYDAVSGLGVNKGGSFDDGCLCKRTVSYYFRFSSAVMSRFTRLAGGCRPGFPALSEATKRSSPPSVSIRGTATSRTIGEGPFFGGGGASAAR